jgi:hypothetical protein
LPKPPHRGLLLPRSCVDEAEPQPPYLSPPSPLSHVTAIFLSSIWFFTATGACHRHARSRTGGHQADEPLPPIASREHLVHPLDTCSIAGISHFPIFVLRKPRNCSSGEFLALIFRIDFGTERVQLLDVLPHEDCSFLRRTFTFPHGWSP